jgi:2-keto-3-deoxy-L-rhamnonate aldolase RhmA
MVIIQIEDIKAMPNLADVLDVEGVDLVFIGRNDLAHSMGFPGQSGHAKVEKVVDEIVSMTLDKGLNIGVSTTAGDSAKWIEKGAKFMSLSFIPTMLKSWRGMIEEIKSHA